LPSHRAPIRARAVIEASKGAGVGARAVALCWRAKDHLSLVVIWVKAQKLDLTWVVAGPAANLTTRSPKMDTSIIWLDSSLE